MKHETGENLASSCYFIHHKSHMAWHGTELRKPSINRLSPGTITVKKGEEEGMERGRERKEIEKEN